MYVACTGNYEHSDGMCLMGQELGPYAAKADGFVMTQVRPLPQQQKQQIKE